MTTDARTSGGKAWGRVCRQHRHQNLLCQAPNCNCVQLGSRQTDEVQCATSAFKVGAAWVRRAAVRPPSCICHAAATPILTRNAVCVTRDRLVCRHVVC
jgi:hypothetical protein